MRRSIVNGAQRRYKPRESPIVPVVHPNGSMHDHRFADEATCSDVEQAVSVEETRGEARLMIRGDRSMVRERMYGDVWTRVALVDRLIRFASETS